MHSFSTMPYMQRLFLTFACLVATFHTATAEESPPQATGPTFAVRLKDGRTISSRLVQADGSRAIGLASGSHSLVDVQRLDLPARQPDQVDLLPLKRIVLVNGDSLTVPLISVKPDGIRVANSGLAGPIPLNVVASIDAMEGARDLFCVLIDEANQAWSSRPAGTVVDDAQFGEALKLVSGSTAELVLPRNFSEGEFSLWLKMPQGNVGEIGETVIEFGFADPAKIVVVAWNRTDAGSVVRVTGETRQSTLRQGIKAGEWLCVRLLLSEQLIVAIDRSVVASLPGNTGGLRSVKVNLNEDRQNRPAPAELLIGPCFAREHAEVAGRRSLVGQQDALELRDGIAVYGKLTRGNASQMELLVRGKQRTASWAEMHRVLIGTRPLQPAAPPTGYLARIDLQLQRSSSTPSTLDSLQGAITAIREGGLELQHPLLEPVRIGWDQVRRITPLFRGTSYPLELRVRHLGNSLRDDFQHPEPEGPRLKSLFELPSRHVGNGMLTFTLRDLEPSGPDTLRASPALADLRDGYLATVVYLNGKLLCRLNDRISTWSTSSEPQRIRVPVAASFLLEGTNSLELRQQSARRDETLFDDTEVLSISFDRQEP